MAAEEIVRGVEIAAEIVVAAGVRAAVVVDGAEVGVGVTVVAEAVDVTAVAAEGGTKLLATDLHGSNQEGLQNIAALLLWPEPSVEDHELQGTRRNIGTSRLG